MTARETCRAAIAVMVGHLIRLGLALPSDRLLRLASFAGRQGNLDAADLAALPGRLPGDSAVIAQAMRGDEVFGQLLYRLARVVGRYEKLRAARLAREADAAVA